MHLLLKACSKVTPRGKKLDISQIQKAGKLQSVTCATVIVNLLLMSFQTATHVHALKPINLRQDQHVEWQHAGLGELELFLQERIQEGMFKPAFPFQPEVLV